MGDDDLREICAPVQDALRRLLLELEAAEQWARGDLAAMERQDNVAPGDWVTHAASGMSGRVRKVDRYARVRVRPEGKWRSRSWSKYEVDVADRGTL